MKKRVPREVATSEVKKVKKKGVRPVERFETRYYEIEYITDYVEELQEEVVVEMVEQEVEREVVHLVPHEVQYVHLPQTYFSQVKQGNASLVTTVG